MMRMFKIILSAAVLLAVPAIFAGCGDELAELRISGDTYLYIPSVDSGTESEMTSEPETVLSPETAMAYETTKEPETAKAHETIIIHETTATPESIENTVYWVSSGKVWHATENCKTLSRSKNIKSGTVADAIEKEKQRACSVCGS